MIIESYRLVYKKFTVALSDMEEVADAIRRKSKHDGAYAKVYEEANHKMNELRGDNGVKERYLDFVESSEQVAKVEGEKKLAEV